MAASTAARSDAVVVVEVDAVRRTTDSDISIVNWRKLDESTPVDASTVSEMESSTAVARLLESKLSMPEPALTSWPLH
eukprot:6108625-Prymnesium_polylepis.1